MKKFHSPFSDTSLGFNEVSSEFIEGLQLTMNMQSVKIERNFFIIYAFKQIISKIDAGTFLDGCSASIVKAFVFIGFSNFQEFIV